MSIEALNHQINKWENNIFSKEIDQKELKKWPRIKFINGNIIQ